MSDPRNLNKQTRIASYYSAYSGKSFSFFFFLKNGIKLVLSGFNRQNHFHTIIVLFINLVSGSFKARNHMFHHWFLAPVQPRAAAMMTTIRRMSTYKDTLNFTILLGVLYYNDVWTITSMKSKSASHRSCPQPSHVQSTWLQSIWLWKGANHYLYL